MRILRHEAGHAIDNAYLLRRRRKRQALFGPSSNPYPEWYTPRPYSRSFVLHLDYWYAQSHPDEDFAETFAVWLTPNSDWLQRYKGWRALGKLEYMDGLMSEITGTPMLIRTRRKVEPLQKLRQTLRAHYARKRRHYGVEHPHFYDRDLRRLFSDKPEFAGNMKAARWLAVGIIVGAVAVGAAEAGPGGGRGGATYARRSWPFSRTGPCTATR